MTRTRITTDGITDASVTTQKINDSAVTTGKIADGAVTDAKINDVAAAKITGQIATAQVADGSITDAKITTAGLAAASINWQAIQPWAANTSYAKGALVEFQGIAYRRSAAGTSGATFNTANWQQITPTTIPNTMVTGLGTMSTETATNYLARAGGVMTGQLVATAGTASAPGVAISGDTDTGIVQAGGADTVGVVTGGVERWRVGADGATQSVIPGGSTLLPQFQCRAWVNFDGTRDSSGAASTANTARLIRGSGNVSQVVRNAAGDYTITFSTAMPDANYCVTGTCGTGAANAAPTSCRPAEASATTVRVVTCFTGGTSVAVFEANFGYVAIFR